MGECKDYIICCADDVSCTDFTEQLESMYEECMIDGKTSLNLLKKELCFKTYEEAKQYLNRLNGE